MKRIASLLAILIIVGGCANYDRLIEKRQGTTYIVDRASFGSRAVVRTYDYDKYYLVAFKNMDYLRLKDKMLINPDITACKDGCKTYKFHLSCMQGNVDLKCTTEIEELKINREGGGTSA